MGPGLSYGPVDDNPTYAPGGIRWRRTPFVEGPAWNTGSVGAPLKSPESWSVSRRTRNG